MANYVLKIGEDQYVFWDSFNRQALTSAMTRTEARECRWGQQSIDIAGRLMRADNTGTSSFNRGKTVSEEIAKNRAGLCLAGALRRLRTGRIV